MIDVNVSNNHDLANFWAEFIEPYNYDWFATFTFHSPPHEESAGKLFNNFVHAIDREIYGQNYWKDKRKGIFYARGTEYQRRGALHYHALIGGIPDYVNPVKYQNWWYERAGLCRIEKYDSTLGGAAYLSKSAYTFKRGEIDFNDCMVHEVNKTRICAKQKHLDFVKAYASADRLRPSLQTYSLTSRI